MKSNEKRTKKNTPEWIESLRSLLDPVFVEINGKVFQVWNRSEATRCRRRYSSKTPHTVDENTDNHEHFWFFDGSTVEGVRRNHLIAEVVRMAWSEILAQRFPEKRFRLFVSNEFSVDGEAGDGEDMGVDTVLRLWSIDPTTSASFDACYRPDLASADKVLWIQFPEKGLRPVEEMLTIIAAGSEHAEYQEALARQRRSHAI